jgi:phospholipase/lecithinase/hemolysin
MKYLLTKSLIATAGITFFTLLSPFKTLGATFDSFQVFGDSLSDPGNLYQLTGNLYPPSPRAVSFSHQNIKSKSDHCQVK